MMHTYGLHKGHRSDRPKVRPSAGGSVSMQDAVKVLQPSFCERLSSSVDGFEALLFERVPSLHALMAYHSEKLRTLGSAASHTESACTVVLCSHGCTPSLSHLSFPRKRLSTNCRRRRPSHRS